MRSSITPCRNSGSNRPGFFKVAALVCLSAATLASCGDVTRDRDVAATPSDPAVSTSTLAGDTQRPVKIGLDGPRFDACPSYGKVADLNPRGNDYLAVRARPTSEAPEIDRLPAGTSVSMCQQVGDWYGVVYPPTGEQDVTCGTGSPVPGARDYEGPCRSGWVNENFIKLIGG